MKNTAVLDESNGPILEKLRPFAGLQAVQDGLNLLLAYVQFPKLLAELDTDNLSTSNYAATLTPLSPANVRTQFNAILAKVDTDAIPAGSDYAATLTAAADSDLPTKWPLLLTKLGADNSANKANYVPNHTLPFVTTLNAKPTVI